MATRSNATATSAVVVTAAATAAVLVVAYTYYWTHARYQKTDNKDTTTTLSPQETLDLIRRRRSIFPKHYSSDSNGGHVVDRQVVDDMLEAATWAPSHHLTEPWHFIVFHENRQELGQFMAEQYKANAGDDALFVEAKYQKKIQNCIKASFVICLLCTLDSDKNPPVEDVCSVAAAVQNMHLVATANHVGAYWSTSGIYATRKPKNSNKNKSSLSSLSSFPQESKSGALLLLAEQNPKALCEFLNLKDNDFCLGWMFVGPFDGKWPQGRRTPCRVQER